MARTPSPPGRRSEAERVVVVVLTLVLVAFGVLVGIVHQGFEALSGARAYVGGEGHWSKAQKDAVYHLMRYALLEEEDGYARFLEELDVTLGDRQGRLELVGPEPDLDRVREGFLRGRNHPDDVDRMATFFLRYRRVPAVDRAVTTWAEADGAIDDLLDLGAEIRRVREAGGTGADLLPLLGELDEVNAHLTELEARFSAELGAGARWAQWVLLLLVAGTALLLAFLTVGLAWLLTRRLARFEVRLKASEVRFRGLFEHSPFGVYRSTLEGRILEANPALVRTLGYSSEHDLKDLDMARDLYLDPDRRSALVQRSLVHDGVFRNVEAEWKRADGTPILVSLTGRVLRNEGGEPTGYEMFVEDVTGRRTLESQLRQAQKMEALGQLTGGIAHDFNNLLTVILSSAGFLREDLEDGEEAGLESDPEERRQAGLGGDPEERGQAGAGDDPKKKREVGFPELGEIERAARRGAEMVAKLLAFSRQTALELTSLNLPTLVRESHGVLRRVLPTSIDIRLRLDEDCPPVVADAGSLEQILLNLAMNARDAMPDGGTLEISVEVRESGSGSDAWVVLAVRDSGDGMSPDILDRVFEPFFTTKPLGEGTGLGLPMVYGLSRQQGGWVEVDSEPRGGTEVRVMLRPDVGAGAETHRGDDPPGLGERAMGLLLHRDPTVRGSVARLLVDAGLEVVVVRSSEELRNRFGADPDRFSIVVKQSVDDVEGHAKLRDELRARRPDLPFLILGGFSAQDTPAPTRLPGGIVVLHDAWRESDLEVQIQELLHWSREVRGGRKGEPGPDPDVGPTVHPP